MNIACIDLEGVLAPEMWPHVALHAGIPELAATTREEPDYPQLMRRRISLLRQHGLKFLDVQRIVATLPVLEGAADFLSTLRLTYHVLVVSDAFMELAAQFGPPLGEPEFQCHRLTVDGDGFIDGCRFLPRRGKEETVRLYQEAGHHILAVGDAFNDLAMLDLADIGFLFRPSPQTVNAARGLRTVTDYDEILRVIGHGEHQSNHLSFS
ncbi:MAG: bifunctional phosphoserine phosphatase/homoserine phosphotransferase ThrH [Pseudomonadota bacterium]